MSARPYVNSNGSHLLAKKFETCRVLFEEIPSAESHEYFSFPKLRAMAVARIDNVDIYAFVSEIKLFLAKYTVGRVFVQHFNPLTADKLIDCLFLFFLHLRI